MNKLVKQMQETFYKQLDDWVIEQLIDPINEMRNIKYKIGIQKIVDMNLKEVNS